MRIHVSRRIPDKALKSLRATGWDIFVGPEEIPNKKRFVWAAGGCDGLLSLLTETVGAEVMDACPNLKVISQCATGVDNIDLEEAEKRGIIVCNTPGVLAETCADFTWALMLGLSRRLVEGDRLMRERKYPGWGPLMLMGTDLYGSTLGLIGMGEIAREVAKRAAGFGMKVLYWSRSESTGGERVDTLEELLQRSDVVSLHVPLTDDTHHLINAQRLAQMRKTAFLINTSRGPVVDEKALSEALDSETIAGAALDVFENEPEVYPGLLSSTKVLLTPHIASSSLATRERMAQLAVDNLVAVLRGEQPLHRVV